MFMSGIWNRNIGLSIFGESHGELIGITLNNIPAGVQLDLEFIQEELDRRKPGGSLLATPRKESDALNIVSGFFNGYTTGAPLTLMIKNTNKKSRDYGEVEKKFRPGHADYTAEVKYRGYADYRGGGHFSGRLTAGMVFAGAIAKQILAEKGIVVGGIITKIGTLEDARIDSLEVTGELLSEMRQLRLPVINEEQRLAMEAQIHEKREQQDSIGGIVRCFALNLPAGLGSPFFESFESVLAKMVFSIPAIKGIEFGSGFDLAEMPGSDSNDEFYVENDSVKTYTNHNGGILGGITNGMPMDFSVVVKSTPSISKPQRTVEKDTLDNTDIEVHGRHDPCILSRVVPVIESALALVILDFLFDNPL